MLFPLVLAVPTLGWIVYLNSQLGDVPRFGFNIDRADRPPAGPGDSMNILLAGVDDLDRQRGPRLQDALTADEWPAGVFRSDAIMVLHLAPDRENAQLISVPRDSYVRVSGYGTTKINAAFSYGGPELLARTVEDLTDLRIDHAVVVDFDGLSEITDIVGGVTINFSEAERDPETGEYLGPGSRRLDGEQALAYVRERKGLPGGDFDRVQRQQNYLRALMSEVITSGALRDPRTLTLLMGSLEDAVAVDQGLTSSRMRSLAWSSRHLRPDDLRFATVPHHGSATVDQASVVMLDLPAVRAMFRAVKEDRLPQWLDDNPEARELPGPRDVR